MNLYAGIAIAVAGVLLAVFGVLGIVPGSAQPGVFGILTGLLIVGLSFISRPDKNGEERVPTASTLIDVFFSPAAAFRSLRTHPRWLVAVLIMVGMSVAYTNLFMYRLTPERVTNFTVDKTLEMSFLTDEARAQIESGRSKAIEDAKSPVTRAGQAVSSFAGHLYGYAFLAAIFFLFALALGGQMNYWQAFSVAVYGAFPVAVIRFVLNSVILFVKDPNEIHPITGQTSLIQDNLGFLLNPADSPVLYVLLSTIGLLGLYWVWLNAVGMANAGEKVSSSTGWTASVSVYALMVLLAVVSAWMFPGFIS